MPIKLCTMFGRLLCWYIVTLYIHFRGLLPPDGILPRAKFTLRPSLALSYIGSVTARHSSIGRQPNFAACYKEWNYVTFAEGVTYIRLGGHHVGHNKTRAKDVLPNINRTQTAEITPRQRRKGHVCCCVTLFPASALQCVMQQNGPFRLCRW